MEGRGKLWGSQGGDGESRQASTISSTSEVSFCYKEMDLTPIPSSHTKARWGCTKPLAGRVKLRNKTPAIHMHRPFFENKSQKEKKKMRL